MIALKGPFRQVAIDVDGTYGIICTRHVNGNNCFAFDIYGLNIVIFQEVYINLLLVIDNIPQVLTNLISIVNTENTFFLSPGGFLPNLIYSAHSDCIESLIADGRFVMRGRKIKDEAAILANAKEQIAKII